jgi:hypothetical protein
MASGNSAQIMWGAEATAGVYVTPTVANPLLPGESITIEPQTLKSEGIISGKRFRTSEQVNGGNIVVGGEFQCELYNRGLGKIFKNLLGAVNTTGGPAYEHVFTPGDPADDPLTIQVGMPTPGGTVHPKTISGAMINAASIAGTAGEIVTMGATVVGMKGHVGSRVVTDGVLNETTTVTSATAVFTNADLHKPIYGTGIPTGAYITARASATSITISAAATATATSVSVTIGTPLASASYAASQYPFKFSHGSLSLFGSAIANCSAFTLDFNNNLAAERRFLGTRYVAQPIESGLREYTGNVTLEFDSLTQLDRMAAGTEGALSLAFAIPGTTDTATIAGNIHYEPFTPTVSGRDILTQEIPFEFVASSTDASAITITLVNADSAA